MVLKSCRVFRVLCSIFTGLWGSPPGAPKNSPLVRLFSHARVELRAFALALWRRLENEAVAERRGRSQHEEDVAKRGARGGVG